MWFLFQVVISKRDSSRLNENVGTMKKDQRTKGLWSCVWVSEDYYQYFMSLGGIALIVIFKWFDLIL